MGGRYAEGTTVTVERSKAEIEGTVRRYGATSFISGYDEHSAFVLFKANGRMVRFHVPIPAAADPMFARDGRKNTRTPEQRQRAAAGEEMRLWRCLLLAIKSKLEVVESGISSFEQEFLAHIVLPDSTTVADWIGPQLEDAYASGTMPAALPALGPTTDRLELGPGDGR
jgi:hypothetical protein